MSTTQQVFNGRYEIVRSIARGGMAEVFLAHDQLLDRDVALKVLFPELSVDKAFVERFRREAQNAANLSHPNIVSVYDWGQEDSTYYIVMEYIDGTPVSELLRQKGPCSPEKAAAIGADVASALDFAHKHGVIHRDVKPANILINRSGQVKVTDFGIARARNVEGNLTQTGTVMGTATYFSPEQAQGLNLDGRSDIYALGVVMYEMVTGTPPFSGDNPVTIATKHVNEVPQDVTRKNPSIPAPLGTIIMTAMQKNPAQRYASGADFAADLKRFLNGQSINAVNATQVMTAATAKQRYSEATNTQAMQQPTMVGAPAVKHKSRADTYLILLVIMLLAVGGLLLFLWRGLNQTSAQVSVPSVIGKTQAEAESILKSNGLKVGSITEKDSPGKAGLVSAQDPQGDTKVKRGTSVNLTVNKKPAEVTVPDLIGKTEDQARSKLDDLNLNSEVTQQNSDKPEGTVIAQDPAKGQKVNEGDTVTLTVSSGQNTVAVPDVSGLTSTEAANRLGQAGFTTGVEHQYSDSVNQGRVIATDPINGTQLAKGSTVVIIVSDGPTPDSTTDTTG
jgi:serine/threonine protein kinase